MKPIMPPSVSIAVDGYPNPIHLTFPSREIAVTFYDRLRTAWLDALTSEKPLLYASDQFTVHLNRVIAVYCNGGANE